MKTKILSLLMVLCLLVTSVPFVAVAATAGEVHSTGAMPSSPDISYELTYNSDATTLTLRLWAPSGNGSTVDYQASGGTPVLSVLPWNSGDLSKLVTVAIVEDSVKYLGQYVLNVYNMSNCTDIYLMGKDLVLHSSAVNVYKNMSTVIHSYTDINAKGMSTQDHFQFSYLEAEDFEAKYSALWSVDEGNSTAVTANATAICNAKAELATLSSKEAVYLQLQTDTIGSTSVTYVAKVNALYNALPDEEKSSVTYALTNNNTTLTLSGLGTVPDYATAPWADYCGTITQVVISEGITAIAAGAFSDLTALNTVDMAKTVETVEAGAFPASAFTMKGWLNHASGKYAEANSNVSLKLKEVRILSLGNSHTQDYIWWFKTILSDLQTAAGTTFTHESVTKGARRMYSTTASAGSHYDGAKTSTDTHYAQYRAAFAKTWDFVVIQDYHESTYANGGAAYADEVAATVAWLREDAPGAKVAWFADLVEPQNRSANRSGGDYYTRSVAAMQAAAALTENAPDLIIPISTLWENAYTTYFGTTLNRTDVSSDYDPGNADLPILERDSAHVSHLLGRQITGMAVMYFICDFLEGKFPAAFDYFDAIVTKPTSAQSEYSWKGAFLDEYWPIIEETISNTAASPYAVTQSAYTVDPFDAKFTAVKNVMAKAATTLPATLSQSVLEAHFKTAAIAAELSAIEGLGTITTNDITVTYTAADGSTPESISVEVDCHYGLSFSRKPAYSTGDTLGDMILVETGKLPTSLGEEESTLYQIYLNADGVTHSVYIHNPSYTASTPDYIAGSTGLHLGLLPWNVAPYKDTVTSITVEDSINYLGQYLICTNYAQAVTDIHIKNPEATLHTNMLFDQNDKGDTVHTLHLYSGVDVSGLAKKSFYSFSYYEAEEYIETYNALWTVDENDVSAVLAKGSAILNASNAIEALPTVAKTQLSTDTLPNSAVTYSAKLAALQATLAANTDASGGDVNGDGLVNLLDVMITLRRLAGKDYNGAMEPREMFLNGDNVADMADAVLMLRRAAGWDVVTSAAPTDVTILYNSETFTYYYEEA